LGATLVYDFVATAQPPGPEGEPVTPAVLKTQLAGVHAFTITPFRSDGEVDLNGVRENVDWLAASGVSTIVAPSGTGELFGLSPDEVLAVLGATVDAVRKRVPVIAGVGFSARVGAQIAKEAQARGADGILALPPYYSQPDAQGLVDYYREIANATDLGLIVYARDSAFITPQLLDELVRVIPTLVALKDGRGDVRLFQRLRGYVSERHGRERLVWLAGVGDDLVAPYFSVGAEGYTSSLACFWPEISLELLDLARSSNLEGMLALQARAVWPFYELRQRRKGFEVAVMKAAMTCLGYKAGSVRAPLGNLSDEDVADLRGILAQLGVPTAADRGVSATVRS
jgi:5-dehydro-4-deoxyglucarate dehydratase